MTAFSSFFDPLSVAPFARLYSIIIIGWDKTGTARDKTGTARDKTSIARDNKGQPGIKQGHLGTKKG